MTVIALITGASGGIGRALARQLHTQGAARLTGQVIALDGGFTVVRPRVR